MMTALAIALASPATLAIAPPAGVVSGDLTGPSGGAPFGGADAGSWQAAYAGNDLAIVVQVLPDAPEGHVLEGWLVDVQSGFKLSLGLVTADKLLVFEDALVNPFVYDVLVITLEPVDDADPNPGAAFGGSPLPAPFGQ